MAPRESLTEILQVRTTPSPGTFCVELESFWGKPVVGDLLGRLVLAAHAAGESAPLQSLQTTLTPKWLIRGQTPDEPPEEPLGLVQAAATLDIHLRRRGDGICRFEVVRGDELVCDATARFAASRAGPGYQRERAPVAPDPDSLPGTAQYARSEGWPEEYARGPFEFRRVGARVGIEGGAQPHVTWLRPRTPLPDGSHWHTAALLLASEFYSHWAFEWRLGSSIDVDAYTPLEHTIWLHGIPRFDDWVLAVAISDRAANGYAVARRSLFARDGSLIASAMHSGYVSRTGDPK